MKKRSIAIALPSTGEEELAALKEPIESGWLTQGPKVAEFERLFAEYHEVNHAYATTSCTTGLHLILAALGVGPGDEVIVPAFTWVATPNVVVYCGATPVFVDVDPSTFNMDPKQLSKLVTDKTKAVIAVHLFGLCADIRAIRQHIPAHVAIVEDAACAAGARINDKYAGGLGDAASFSFHPRKSITTGEGGMVTTNDESLGDLLDRLRNHGASISEEQRHRGPKPYLLPEFNLLGFNYRMTDLQGAVGIVQMGRLRGFVEERQQWAEYYMQQLADVDWLQLPTLPENGQHAWQSFVTIVDPEKSPLSRNEIMQHLQEEGVSTRPGTHAPPMLGYYREVYGSMPEAFEKACYCSEQSMAIPLHNRMSEDDYQYVVHTIQGIR